MSVKDLMKKHNVTSRTVYNIFHENGVRFRDGDMTTEERHAEILRLHDEGISGVEIAKIVNRSRSMVSLVIKGKTKKSKKRGRS